MEYIPPTATAKMFNCPHCGVVAHQTWIYKTWQGSTLDAYSKAHLAIGRCAHCGKNTLWHEDVMLVPDRGNAPVPNDDMPSPVKALYGEAASIANKSPRGAAAILRLAVQVLCKELGEKGKNIDDDIGGLVKKGLPEMVQKSLDVVRVTGNNAVHPGVIDTDNPETVGKLFRLLNIIVEYTITMPKHVNGIFDNLPPGAKAAIAKRDQ